MAPNLEKVRQTSVWKTVSKFWFIWLCCISVLPFALLTRAGTVNADELAWLPEVGEVKILLYGDTTPS